MVLTHARNRCLESLDMVQPKSIDLGYVGAKCLLEHSCAPRRGYGGRENGSYVLARIRLTFTEILRPRGWRTGALISGLSLSERFGLAQDFDHSDDALAEDNAAPPRDEGWQGVPRPYLDRFAGPVVRRALR